jgi:transcriptional regulator with XRE-family HTH domain
MDRDKATELGEYLRQQREAKGVSARSLATIVGVDIAQIVRLEQGVVASPKADVLAAIAEYLDLPLADMFGLAGYTLPTELPSFKPYMRAKYREFPDDAVEELERFFTRLAKKHGVTGPVGREDER